MYKSSIFLNWECLNCRKKAHLVQAKWKNSYKNCESLLTFLKLKVEIYLMLLEFSLHFRSFSKLGVPKVEIIRYNRGMKIKCQKCGKEEIWKSGKTGRKQQYQCKSCKRKFITEKIIVRSSNRKQSQYFMKRIAAELSAE